MGKNNTTPQPFRDITNISVDPQYGISDEEQKRDEEKRIREKKAKYMCEYRSRKKAEANKKFRQEIGDSTANNSVLSEICASVALAQCVQSSQRKRRADITADTQLRNDVSTISEHMPQKENVEPNKNNDWMHIIDITSNMSLEPKSAVPDEEQRKRDEEKQRREKKAKYMRKYRARKKTEANMESRQETEQYTQLATDVSTILQAEHTPKNANCNPDETTDWLHRTEPKSGVSDEDQRKRDEESREKKAKYMREYRSRKKTEANMESRQETEQYTQLGTDVSMILQAEHTLSNENADPDETTDWLHRNDNYRRKYNNIVSCNNAKRVAASTKKKQTGAGTAESNSILSEICASVARVLQRGSSRIISEQNETEFDSAMYEPTNPNFVAEEYLDKPHGEDIADMMDHEMNILLGQDEDFESYRVPVTGVDVTDFGDPYDYVYHNLPAKHHHLKNVPDCEYCGTMRFQYEPPGFCCRKGKIKIHIPDVPAELKRLFTNQVDRDAKYFRKHIRKHWVRNNNPNPISLSLKKLQEILNVHMPMDIDCFNLAVRMWACSDEMLWYNDTFEPNVHILDLQLCGISTFGKDPRDCPNVDAQHLAKLFKCWADLSKCTTILLPHSYYGHFTLFIIDIKARSVTILDPVVSTCFNSINPTICYCDKLHYIANYLNLTMKMVNPNWHDDIYA